MSNTSNVHFNDAHNQVHNLYENMVYNYNPEYQQNRKINRVLSRMERYFRIHHLLDKNEMLEIRHSPSHELRAGFMDVIGRERGWLYGDEFIAVVR